MKTGLLVRGQWGLGDNIFQRPYVREAAHKYEVYLDTPWPELFEDLDGVRFVRAPRALRTQLKNQQRQPNTRWTKPPLGARAVTIGYGARDLQIGSIIQALDRQYGAVGVRPNPFTFDLPGFGPPPIGTDRPIAVIRPVTVRKEWRNEARNPLPEYVNLIASDLKRTHYVVAVADLRPNEEWLIGEMPAHDAAFMLGELTVTKLLALCAASDVIVGGVGWIVPAAVALKKKAFVILGGHGGHNAPEKITDPRMDLLRLGFAIPEKFCKCTAMLHHCDKTISNLPVQWETWKIKTGLCFSDGAPRAA